MATFKSNTNSIHSNPYTALNNTEIQNFQKAMAVATHRAIDNTQIRFDNALLREMSQDQTSGFGLK